MVAQRLTILLTMRIQTQFDLIMKCLPTTYGWGIKKICFYLSMDCVYEKF